jgi:hypothetical protein
MQKSKASQSSLLLVVAIQQLSQHMTDKHAAHDEGKFVQEAVAVEAKQEKGKSHCGVGDV